MKKFKVKIQDTTNTDHYVSKVHIDTYGIETHHKDTAAIFNELGVRAVLDIFTRLPKTCHKLIIERSE